jgi:preprotein translocase subunit SecD
MTARCKAFNIYLFLSLTALLFSACQTEKQTTDKTSPKKPNDKKLAAVLRLHLETRADSSPHKETVSILRDNPVQVTIQKSPFLNEANVAAAKVVDAIGGFAISLKFDRRGRWLLEQYSSANSGRRFAIYVQFGEKMKESRWLAAPLIQRRISDGVLTFTPDATHEEAEQIVKGLTNVAKKVQGKNEEW